jgi:hypothetical protein
MRDTIINSLCGITLEARESIISEMDGQLEGYLRKPYKMQNRGGKINPITAITSI